MTPVKSFGSGKLAVPKCAEAEVEKTIEFIRVLEANGDIRRKVALGVSNQEYPNLRDACAGWLIVAAVRLAIAEDLIRQKNSGDQSWMEREYEQRVRDAVGSIA